MNAKAQIDSNFHHGHSCPSGFGCDCAAGWFDTRSRCATRKGSECVDAHISSPQKCVSLVPWRTGFILLPLASRPMAIMGSWKKELI